MPVGWVRSPAGRVPLGYDPSVRAALALALALPLLALGAASAPPSGHDAVAKRLAERIGSFRGEMGLFAKEIDTGETFAVNADGRFPTASLIKVAVMAEVYRQIAEGKLTPGTTVVLKESDKAGDEGVPLNVLHAGVTLTVSDLVRLMIGWSDNTATNLLVGLVGTRNVDALLDAHGLTRTRLYRPTFRDGRADVLPEEEKEFGLGSTTPREAARLLELVAEGKAFGRAASDEMIAILSTQQDRAMIPRLLPFERERILVANKTGWDEEKRPDARGFKGDVRCDAAYVKGARARYVIAICARRIRDESPGVDNEALKAGGELSRMVYDRFSRAAGAR